MTSTVNLECKGEVLRLGSTMRASLLQIPALYKYVIIFIIIIRRIFEYTNMSYVVRLNRSKEIF